MSATGDDEDDDDGGCCYSIALILAKILSKQQLDKLIQILQFVFQHDCTPSVKSLVYNTVCVSVTAKQYFF